MAIDIRKPLRKLLPHLLQAQKDNLNEADTVLRLIKMFEDVLGWDAMSEVSREAHMKNKYVDIVLKLDGVIKILVEAKAAGEKLRDHHVEQAELYASENNYHWVVLTNGVVWNLYHLTFDEGIDYEKAFSIDLSDETKFEANVERLSLLHRQAVKRNEHEGFWEKTAALSSESIGRVLFEEHVLNLIRREVHRSKGVMLDVEDIALAIHDQFTPEAREKIGPPKIRRHTRKPRREAANAPLKDASKQAEGGALALVPSAPSASTPAVEPVAEATAV